MSVIKNLRRFGDVFYFLVKKRLMIMMKDVVAMSMKTMAFGVNPKKLLVLYFLEEGQSHLSVCG